MIRRKLQSQIEASLQHFPAVGLIGARQVGKTTLAKMMAKDWASETLYLDLENPAHYATLAEPVSFLSRHADKLVIIDEVQQRSELFPALRSLIDEKRRAGRFLLLGSSSPDLMRQSGESLAGRIAYHELPPLILSELNQKQKEHLWIRGGFPDSILAKTETSSIQWRENFILTYLQKDLAFLGYDMRTSTMTLRRFWQMLAHSHGQPLNLSQLGTNLELARQSVKKYLDILQQTFMVRQLQPYHGNLKKRLIKTPKIYLRDSGILHTLLRINNLDELMGHTALGMSWEGFCLEQILTQMPSEWDVFYFRTRAKAEVDLVIQKQFGDAPILVEFKFSQSPKLSKGFWSSHNDLKPQASYVVHSGSNAFPLSKSVEAIPISQLNKIWE